MSTQNDAPNDNTFDVVSFIRSLEKKAATTLKRWGCIKCEECGHDVVSDLLPKHSRHIGDKIVLDHPAALKQLPFLYNSLKFALQNKKRNCKDCRPGILPIVEEPDPDDPYLSSTGPIEPGTPESIYQTTEVVERVLSRIKNKTRRAAFRAHELNDYTCEEIAAELGVKPTRVRKWIARDRAFLRTQFPTFESLWRDWQDDGQGLGESLP